MIPLFFAIILMLSSVSVYATTLELTVRPSKASYLVGDQITIGGQLKSDGVAVGGTLIAVMVSDSDKIPIVIRTLSTDSTGGYALNFKLTTKAKSGIYSAYVSAEYQDIKANASATFSVKTPETFDFTLSASPSSISIRQGESAIQTVAATLTNGTAQTTSLTVSGLPSGTTAIFTPSSVTPTGTSALTITTSASVPTGSYTLTITGTGGGQTHSTTVTLTVTPAQPLKTSSAISISASPSTFSVGGTAVVSGSISPPTSSQVTLEYSTVGGTWNALTTVTAQTNGSYSYRWTPDKAGTYEIRATWPGDNGHEAAVSPNQTVTVSQKQCIIATAAYGSELNPHVQFLREFRENIVLKTFAGTEFMEVFNAWYYSFSPDVAGFISTESNLMTATRGLIYPLLGILHLAVLGDTAIGYNSEPGIILTGILVSSLIGLVYFTPLTIIPLYVFKRWKKNLPRLCKPKILVLPWVASILITILGELTLSSILTMAGTAALVVSTIVLIAVTISSKIVSKIT